MLKRLRNSLIGGVGPLLLRLLWSTLRVSLDDRSGSFPPRGSEPVIYAFWHNRMLLMPPFHRKYLNHRKVVCLVSASADGEMIARVLEAFGLGTARGSSSRRGSEALRELAVHFENGHDVAITPDGPRGPRYEVQPGIVGLARRRGAAIIPLSYTADSRIELQSWDRFFIPLPFTRVRFVVGEPILAGKGPDQDEFEGEQKKLEEALSALAGMPPERRDAVRG